MNPVFIYETPDDGHYVLVRGRVGGWFRDQRIPAYRSNIHNGWWLRRERLDDVMALMQETGLWVQYSDGFAPRHVPATADEWRAVA